MGLGGHFDMVCNGSEYPDHSFCSNCLGVEKEEGQLVLSSILIKNSKRCERIVKVGAPANRIIKTANDLNVDIIILGTRGLGHAADYLGHVTRKVLSESHKPVLLLN